MNEATIFRLRETMAQDAFKFRRDIHDIRFGYDNDAQSWRNRMEITDICANHSGKGSIIGTTCRNKENGYGFAFQEKYWVSGDLETPFLVRVYDTHEKIYRDCFSCEFQVANSDRYCEGLKAFYEKWLDPIQEMTQEAERIAAETRRFGEVYDYWDFQDYMSSFEEDEDVAWLLSDVSGKECLAAAKWFYGFEKEQDENDASARSMAEWAMAIRTAFLDFADRWFHNTIYAPLPGL